MKLTIGTSHFASLAAAIAFYRPCLGDPVYQKDTRAIRKAKDEATCRAVQYKLDGGEIHIGKPVLNPGETLLLNREGGRYFIQSDR